jgi:rhodanese-related sulfurtransferase
VPGAVNIAHTRLIERVAEVPRGGTVLVNCLSGGRSGRACAFLRRQGYDAVNVGGGFKAWEIAGLPVEK